MREALLLVTLLLSAALSGCLAESDSEPEPKDCEQADALEKVGCEFPAFTLAADDQSTYNNSLMDEDGRWVAYFSAVWCTHCKPTIDALDTGVPTNRLLVFNKHPGAEFENMSEWKENMREELERNITRPFIHAPDLANNLAVTAIPHVVLIENSTVIAVRYGLWNDANSIATWFESATPASGASQEIESEMDM